MVAGVSITFLMVPQKVVMPAQAGIQSFANLLMFLDSRLRGNDGNRAFLTFCGTIIFCEADNVCSFSLLALSSVCRRADNERNQKKGHPCHFGPAGCPALLEATGILQTRFAMGIIFE
jgi:hypothetical protein